MTTGRQGLTYQNTWTKSGLKLYTPISKVISRTSRCPVIKVQGAGKQQVSATEVGQKKRLITLGLRFQFDHAPVKNTDQAKLA